MNEEEINYWCDVFERYKQTFKSSDGKQISFCKILKGYNQLQNNWNELKKWLIQLQKFKGINQQGFSWGVAQEVLEKMQELEGNNE